jgi:hypothetical protein
LSPPPQAYFPFLSALGERLEMDREIAGESSTILEKEINGSASHWKRAFAVNMIEWLSHPAPI